MYDVKERNKNWKLAKFGVRLETSLDDVGVFLLQTSSRLGTDFFWGELQLEKSRDGFHGYCSFSYSNTINRGSN